jgi:diguanylate cyclase (GGDEF)-like protein
MEVSFNIAFIDLNDFKPINDKYGHAAGDIALKRAADALRSAVRSGDLVGRKGGDEFVVAFLGTEGDKKDTMGMNRYIIAERIRRALLNTGFTYTGKDEAGNPLSPVEIPSITASIGVVKAKPGESLNDVIHGADVRVYEAKAVKEKAKKEYDAKSEEERAKEKPPSQSYLSVEGLEGVV